MNDLLELINTGSRLKKLFRVTVPLLVILILSGCDKNEDWEELSYRVGNIEILLDKSKQNSVYRGMIYEYGIGVGVDTNKARKIYEHVQNKQLSKRRVFLLCFIHCEKELTILYSNLKNTFDDIDFLFSFYLLVNGEDCIGINQNICNLAIRAYEVAGLDSPYYTLGSDLYKKVIKKANSFSDFEISYYLLKKAEENGNSRAKNFLEKLPSSLSWVPRNQ